MSNASAEGFNCKIQWLIRKTYGFRNISYLKLKIFQFPLFNLKNNYQDGKKRQMQIGITEVSQTLADSILASQTFKFNHELFPALAFLVPVIFPFYQFF